MFLYVILCFFLFTAPSENRIIIISYVILCIPMYLAVFLCIYMFSYVFVCFPMYFNLKYIGNRTNTYKNIQIHRNTYKILLLIIQQVLYSTKNNNTDFGINCTNIESSERFKTSSSSTSSSSNISLVFLLPR